MRTEHGVIVSDRPLADAYDRLLADYESASSPLETKRTMTFEERISIEAMFRAFAPEHLERWSYLLTLKPARWSKITPMLAWPVANQSDSSPDSSISDLLRSPLLLPHATTPSVVLRCGHSGSPGIQTLPLSEIFPNGAWDFNIVFEGFVSVVPGKLALGLNHEGGACVYGASPWRR